MALKKPSGVRIREFWVCMGCLSGLLTPVAVADGPGTVAGSAPSVSTGSGAVSSGGTGTPASSGTVAGQVAPGSSSAPPTVPSSTGTGVTGAPQQVLPKLEGRYWFAVVPLGVPSSWTVTLLLNGKSVGVYPISEQHIVEVTSQLRFGDNAASVRFDRPLSVTPGGESDVLPPGDVQVVLAQGQVSGEDESLTLDIPIFRIQRPARELPGTEEVLRFSLPPPWRTRTGQ